MNYDPPSKVIKNSPEYFIFKRMAKMTQENKYWETAIGYTVHDLKKHLESKFSSGMSWNNMAGWHIDHIIPQSFFKLLPNANIPGSPVFRICWALSNLQPLWQHDNLAKHAKIDKSMRQKLNRNLDTW